MIALPLLWYAHDTVLVSTIAIHPSKIFKKKKYLMNTVKSDLIL